MDNGASSYRRYLAGDDDGIAKIVEEYKDGLILYLAGYVKNIYVAEELAEDTFFRLMTKKPAFSGRCSFRSWLYAIGHNAAVDHIRKSVRRATVPIEDMEEYLADEESLERAYLTKERTAALRRALDVLPTDYRQVLWLVFFEEFSNDEAARAMKKSSRQIRNLLYRAKLALRSELEREGFNNEE